MMLKNKPEFERIAHEWAVKHAGATQKQSAEAEAEAQKSSASEKKPAGVER